MLRQTLTYEILKGTLNFPLLLLTPSFPKFSGDCHNKLKSLKESHLHRTLKRKHWSHYHSIRETSSLTKLFLTNLRTIHGPRHIIRLFYFSFLQLNTGVSHPTLYLFNYKCNTLFKIDQSLFTNSLSGCIIEFSVRPSKCLIALSWKEKEECRVERRKGYIDVKRNIHKYTKYSDLYV